MSALLVHAAPECDAELETAQLKNWLSPADENAAADFDDLFGDTNVLPAASERALPFVLATLRDIYADDHDVAAWLTHWRPEHCASAVDMLAAGHTDEVVRAVVRHWNEATALPADTKRRVSSRLLTWLSAAVMGAASSVSAQQQDVAARMTDVLRYTGIAQPAAHVSRMAELWTRAQQPGLASAERQLAFRDLQMEYARLQGRDVTANPQALDGSARFAATIFEGGGRMDLTLPEPRGKPSGNYVHVETRGHGPVPLLLISDIGVDGRKLYDSFIARQGSAYTMHVVTLPFAGGARPLPWPETLNYAARPWLNQIERELLALLDEPRMKQVTVIGTSAGGYFAARMALLRPKQIRAMVLVNALVKMPMSSPSDRNVPASFAERLMLVKAIPPGPQLWPVASIPAADELRRLIEAPVPRHPSVQNWMAFAVKDTAISRAWTLEALAGGFFLPSNEYRWELATTDLSEAMNELTVPTLAIASRHDEASPVKTFPAVSQWEELKQLHPGIPLTVAVLDQTRQYVSADAPHDFDRMLANFLAGQR